MSLPAPVVLFVYNRPAHTRETLTALQANVMADVTDLYIFADGPRPDATTQDLENIKATRAVLREQIWCAKTVVTEREANIGLAANIIDGVTRIVNRYGRVIVLEDDIVTSPSFLTFMNESLDLYANDTAVAHIAGFSFPWIDKDKVGADTYFYRVASCWGWATWDRAWRHYNDNAIELFVSLCEKNMLGKFDLNYSGAFISQLNRNITGQGRTWAVKWYASAMLEGGLSLHPSVSLVNNVGFDSTGTNTPATNVFYHEKLGILWKPELQPVKENRYVANAMSRFYRRPILERIKIFLANRVSNFLKLRYSKMA